MCNSGTGLHRQGSLRCVERADEQADVAKLGLYVRGRALDIECGLR